MYRNCRRRYYTCSEMPNDIIEDTCDCVNNNLFTENNSCDCGFEEEDNILPLNPELAQSYVPFQIMNKTFIPSVGLQEGTIFPELVSLYRPNQSEAEIEYLKANNEIKGGCNDERL